MEFRQTSRNLLAKPDMSALPARVLTAIEAREWANEVLSRVIQLGMKTDRADVIVPAAEIYTRILDLAGCTRILVPKVGLSDGIVLDLFTKWQVEQDKGVEV
jgi:exopolyphosphatase/guanosine-5'-triphosphate,3'-diphosphate pyrophosphatase